MAQARLILDKGDLRSLEKEIERAFDTACDRTYDYFKKTTPIKSGNARSKTRYQDKPNRKTITGDYPYAGRLDEGWSKQAPRGMTEPSLQFLEDELGRQIRRIR